MRVRMTGDRLREGLFDCINALSFVWVDTAYRSAANEPSGQERLCVGGITRSRSTGRCRDAASRANAGKIRDLLPRRVGLRRSEIPNGSFIRTALTWTTFTAADPNKANALNLQAGQNDLIQGPAEYAKYFKTAGYDPD